MTDRLATASLLPEDRVPGRGDTALFAAKAMLLRVRRAATDLAAGPRRHGRGQALAAAPVLGQARMPLWSAAGGAKEQRLNAGKAQNLRAALRGLDGVEVPPGAVLGFWRQVGRPIRRRGFAEGRELREGCMIASVGGGLCQLSGALYEAALAAGIEVVERHRHTRIVPGSRAEAGRDATVFWNYLDLRLRSADGFRIEARLTADSLELEIRGHARALPAPEPQFFLGAAPGDCLTCGRTECSRHDPDTAAARRTGAWLVDAPSPEFAALLAADATPDDLLMLPSRRFGAGAHGWPRLAHEATAELPALRRTVAVRLAPRSAPQAALLMAAEARIVAAYARRLPPEHLHLTVAQPLLPHLWMLGVLQGRSFDVLLDRLPIDALHELLDAARARHPESRTLGDFRAPAAIATAERAALAAARRLLTPHAAVAALFPGRAELLEWAPAEPLSARRRGRAILFPAASLARKGVHALREAVAGLDVELLLPPGAEGDARFWQGCRVRRLARGEIPGELAAVVLPALVEHRPRMLLRAIAAGIPAIATPACGLLAQPGLTLVAPDDPEQLRRAIVAAL